MHEALTTTREHTSPPRANAATRYRSEALELEISSDGRAGPSNGGGGRLIGMRERVALDGRHLDD